LRSNSFSIAELFDQNAPITTFATFCGDRFFAIATVKRKYALKTATFQIPEKLPVATGLF
jgi:hypothetical protein